MLKGLVNVYNFMPIAFLGVALLSGCVVLYVVLARFGVIQRFVSKDLTIPRTGYHWWFIGGLLLLLTCIGIQSYAQAHTKYNVIVYRDTYESYRLKQLSHAYATGDDNRFTVELKSGAVVTYQLKSNETAKIVPYYAK